MITLLLSLLFLAALALTYLARRGRRVGSIPFCQRCHFDLRGKPADSTRCSECGADLTHPHAILLGELHRRPRLLILGLTLLLLTALPLSFIAYTTIRHQNPYRYAPLWYLESQISARIPNRAAGDEIIHRIMSRDLSGPRLSALIDRTLTIQSDSAKPWHAYYEQILVEGGRSAGFTSAQVQRLYQNSYEDVVDIKPKLHQQGDIIPGPVNATFSIRNRRPLLILRWSVIRSYSALTIGSATIFKPLPSIGPGSTIGGYRQWLPRDFPLGKYPLTYSCDYDVALTDPYTSPHAHFTQHFDRTVEVVPSGQITDTLVTDPALEPAIRAAVPEATLDFEPPMPDVVGNYVTKCQWLLLRIRINKPTVNLCMSVFVDRKSPFEGRIATLFLPANDRDEWHVFRCQFPRGITVGEHTNLRLQFSQNLADDESSHLDTYWGSPIVLPDLPIRPFDPAHAFNMDETRRPIIEKSLTCKITRTADQLIVHANFEDAPLPVSYALYLRHKGILYAALSCSYDTQTRPGPYTLSFDGNFDGKLLPPGEKVDILLRPYLHGSTYPATPTPWGGEILLKDQTLP